MNEYEFNLLVQMFEAGDFKEAHPAYFRNEYINDRDNDFYTLTALFNHSGRVLRVRGSLRFQIGCIYKPVYGGIIISDRPTPYRSGFENMEKLTRRQAKVMRGLHNTHLAKKKSEEKAKRHNYNQVIKNLEKI